ncbi:conserved hypothetical protein [Sphingomonas sp. T1]|uniref:hypothetical protein n=1 Tax=Sphingomonas sp. T1 TaxID=2653172 RepID=UPI0012EFC77B|nr:hypothetical protein [Sphingomonas sp. T1]VXD04312.1 conserved hypothetical protein [Sphingomonas sp. T1]
MATQVTRSLHPLPFEHLEPKRFEDLVRQLAYDFRAWRSLEATGRAGSDDGFDARGNEIVASGEHIEVENQDGDGEPATTFDRLWLIQCKRERSIGPTKMIAHLEAIAAESFDGLYGFIFAAACDFSKATRDVCRNWCRERGVQEIHIWGKAEIEDQLYQPKNDNLLFAYFGISLQMRKQSLTTQLRRTTTLKRKIQRHLADEGWPGKPFILRDPSDARYPDPGGKPLADSDCLWRSWFAKGVGIHGLRVLLRCHHGYVNHQTGAWDMASALDRAIPYETEQLWPPRQRDAEASADVITRWTQLPRANQGFLMFVGWLPYEEILEIDEVGDDVSELPTVYARFRNGTPPFLMHCDIVWEASGYRQTTPWRRKGHVRLFEPEFRDEDWERPWAERNSVGLSEIPYALPEADADPA